MSLTTLINPTIDVNMDVTAIKSKLQEVKQFDCKRKGYHECHTMPEEEFAEIQTSNWHIHKMDVPHSIYRLEIIDDKCPYCNCDLNECLF